MLRWPIAANEPSSIEAMETKATISCHCVVIPGKAVMAARTNIAMPATLGDDAKKAETQIFQPPLTRAQRIAMACGDDIERQAHQFEPEIERDQIGRRDQHEHAE